jgi:chemotaxis protein histidine kinase CheA
MLRRAASASSSGRRLSVGGTVPRAAAPGAGGGGGGASSGLPLPPPFGPQQQQRRQSQQQQQEQQQQQQQHSTAPPVSSADASFDESDLPNPPHPLPPRSNSTARAPSLLHEEDLQRFFFAQQAEAAAAEAEGRAHHHLVRPASPVPPFERPQTAAAAAAASSEQQQQRRQRRSTTSTSPVDTPLPPLNHAYYVQATPIPRAFVPPTTADGDALPAGDNAASASRNSNNNSSVAPPMHVTVFTEAEMDAVSAAAVASGLQPPAFDLACDVTTPRPALPLHLQRTTFTVVARRDYADVFLGVTGREQVNGLRGSQVPCYGWRCGAAEAAGGVGGALPLAADGGSSGDGNGNLGRLWRRGDAVELVLEPESPRRDASSGRQGEEEEGEPDDAEDEDNGNTAEGRTMSLLLRVNGREVDRLHGIPAATLISSSSGRNSSSSSAPVWYVGLYASSAEGGAGGGVTGGGNNAGDLAAIMFESASSHSVAWGDFRVQRYT